MGTAASLGDTEARALHVLRTPEARGRAISCRPWYAYHRHGQADAGTGRRTVTTRPMGFGRMSTGELPAFIRVTCRARRPRLVPRCQARDLRPLGSVLRAGMGASREGHRRSGGARRLGTDVPREPVRGVVPELAAHRRLPHATPSRDDIRARVRLRAVRDDVRSGERVIRRGRVGAPVPPGRRTLRGADHQAPRRLSAVAKPHHQPPPTRPVGLPARSRRRGDGRRSPAGLARRPVLLRRPRLDVRRTTCPRLHGRLLEHRPGPGLRRLRDRSLA